MPDFRVVLKEGYKIKIGRSDKCNIQVNNNTLADRHSEICYKDCTFYFKNCSMKYMSWLRLSPKSIRSENFKIIKGDIFRLSSKKSFLVESIVDDIK